MRIFEFAKVASWDERLQTLAELAEPERWTFRTIPDSSPLPVLDSYLKFTFLRLHEQARVAETEDLACFNTGLLTSGQEEIYGLFTLSENFDRSQPEGRENKRWFLKGWARSGDRALTAFAQLPEMASYWSDPAQLIFNPLLHIESNVDHIIRDNLNRFPVELGGQVNEEGVPQDLRIADLGDDEEPTEDLSAPGGQFVVSLPARIALDGAIQHSVRLARRSYRIAVPQFYKNKIQLLLPIYLRDAARADLALTLEQHGGWYRAATVLYPDWGYRHARLLSRPNSEWLGGFRRDGADLLDS
jgi:hypothetical protein